ncbi:hypothetical protein [Williamsia herbipolensis]|uniref:hypothetical protein n=1 Tax=Williamsia herbipolensis TaxID=1603258 RepID=UPI0005F87B41|nr:hypothetical protein [Williamsia herbipolensis]
MQETAQLRDALLSDEPTDAMVRLISAAASDIKMSAPRSAQQWPEKASLIERTNNPQLEFAVSQWTHGGIHSLFIDEWRNEARAALLDPTTADGIGGILVAEALAQPATSTYLYRGVASWDSPTFCDLSSWTTDPLVALIYAAMVGDDEMTVLRLAPGALAADLSTPSGEYVTLGPIAPTDSPVGPPRGGVRVVDLVPGEGWRVA